MTASKTEVSPLLDRYEAQLRAAQAKYLATPKIATQPSLAIAAMRLETQVRRAATVTRQVVVRHLENQKTAVWRGLNIDERFTWDNAKTTAKLYGVFAAIDKVERLPNESTVRRMHAGLNAFALDEMTLTAETVSVRAGAAKLLAASDPDSRLLIHAAFDETVLKEIFFTARTAGAEKAEPLIPWLSSSLLQDLTNAALDSFRIAQGIRTIRHSDITQARELIKNASTDEIHALMDQILVNADPRTRFRGGRRTHSFEPPVKNTRGRSPAQRAYDRLMATGSPELVKQLGAHSEADVVRVIATIKKAQQIADDQGRTISARIIYGRYLNHQYDPKAKGGVSERMQTGTKIMNALATGQKSVLGMSLDF